MREFRLACFPTQVDGTAVAHRRKIEQPQIQILDDAPVRLDAIDEPNDLRFELGESSRAAPVAGRIGTAGAQRRIGLQQPDRQIATLRPQLVEQRFEDRDEGVGLLSRKEFHSMRRLVIVTGLSGAGKSQTMKSLEDFGFACLDNAPPVLARPFVALVEEAERGNAALALDVRTLGAFGDPVAAIAELEAQGLHPEVLFLDAEDETLIRRYSETRRRHPYGEQGAGLGEAIAAERAALAGLRDRADLVWDTTRLTLGQLKDRIGTTFLGADARRLQIAIVAFGFKYGVPLDADLVFDVRFLPNPNYVDGLRDLTGADAPVAAFLEAVPETEPFLDRLLALLDFLVPRYEREGKSQVTIAIGCTGGRHRSVYIGRRILRALSETTGAVATFDARDVTR
jgi:RNase adapter protein RapZ